MHTSRSFQNISRVVLRLVSTNAHALRYKFITPILWVSYYFSRRNIDTLTHWGRLTQTHTLTRTYTHRPIHTHKNSPLSLLDTSSQTILLWFFKNVTIPRYSRMLLALIVFLRLPFLSDFSFLLLRKRFREIL